MQVQVLGLFLIEGKPRDVINVTVYFGAQNADRVNY